MHNYAGNPATYPSTIPLIDDSDSPQASNFNPGPAALADRAAWLKANCLLLSGGTVTGPIVLASGAQIFLTGTAQEIVEVSASILNEGTIEIAGGGSLTFDAASTLQGTVSLGSLTLAGCAITLSNLGSVIANHNQAIQAAAAGAIAPTVAAGIASGIAGGIQSTTPGGIALEGGATDYLTLGPPRNKTSAALPDVISPTAIDGTHWTYGIEDVVGQGTTTLIRLRIPGLHHGATLSTVTITFVVGGVHSLGPANLPGMVVARRANTLGVAIPAEQALAVANFQAFAPSPGTGPGSGAVWVASNHTQALVYTCNQNNVIDLANYSYWIELTDENGTNAAFGNQYSKVTAVYTNITTSAFSDGAMS